MTYLLSWVLLKIATQAGHGNTAQNSEGRCRRIKFKVYLGYEMRPYLKNRRERAEEGKEKRGRRETQKNKKTREEPATNSLLARPSPPVYVNKIVLVD